MENEGRVCVCRAQSPVEAAIVRQLLEASGIETIELGEGFIVPGLDNIQIQVSAVQADLAREILAASPIEVGEPPLALPRSAADTSQAWLVLDQNRLKLAISRIGFVVGATWGIDHAIRHGGVTAELLWIFGATVAAGLFYLRVESEMRAFRCPSCGNRFFSWGRLGGVSPGSRWSKTCVHCGLKKDSANG